MGRCSMLGLAVVCACSGGGTTQPDLPWAVVAQDLPSSLQSVWASSDSDVYVVGGDRGDSTGPIVNHYDGAAWTQLDAGVRNVNLWWVFGFAGGPIFMSGTNGTIVRYQNNAFETLPTPGNLTVFGMWGAAPDDLWAVGGNFGGGGFLWHYDGNAWTASMDVPADIQSQGTIWKINGRSATDIWMGCTGGTMLHWDGTLTRTDLSIDGSLLSVAGNAERFVTVGVAGGGVLYENTGSGWTSDVPDGTALLTGVAISEDQGYAVGEEGTVLRRTDSGWSSEKGLTAQNLHGAFIDPSGGAWAAGGQFDAMPQTDGVLLHKGNALLGSFP